MPRNDLGSLSSIVQPDTLAQAWGHLRRFERTHIVRVSDQTLHHVNQPGNYIGFNVLREPPETWREVHPGFFRLMVQLDSQRIDWERREYFVLEPGQFLSLPYKHFTVYPITGHTLDPDLYTEQGEDATAWIQRVVYGWQIAPAELPSSPFGGIEHTVELTPDRYLVATGAAGAGSAPIGAGPCRRVYLQNVSVANALDWNVGAAAVVGTHGHLAAGEAVTIRVPEAGLIQVIGNPAPANFFALVQN